MDIRVVNKYGKILVLRTENCEKRYVNLLLKIRNESMHIGSNNPAEHITRNLYVFKEEFGRGVTRQEFEFMFDALL